MIYTGRLAQILTTIALFVNVAHAGVGDCHPYPGAVAADCLKLISDNLNNDTQLSCANGPVTISYQNCVMVTRCTEGPADFTTDDVVRRSLTAIGACALSDYGSISGNYITDDGVKTCYLYPGHESRC
ncbi:hypothetical protein M413DRAFT_442342 [Hebeloma cylindrosporum]|uniref:Secreted protein n=1 Tax=Hebeloma cylindrosporum TaxID=76867 RepID=A0A0C3CNR4_HEBCY|nr:hypothetical protein M413DRAFT_442342 [Hebeloma cylindrosporum h7]